MSTDFTPNAKKIMKRAIKNHWRPFDRMFTFTFDPKIETNILDEDGHIDHVWAHKRISRVLATVTQKYNRLYEKTGKDHFRIAFVRVSEIQPETGNFQTLNSFEFYQIIKKHRFYYRKLPDENN